MNFVSQAINLLHQAIHFLPKVTSNFILNSLNFKTIKFREETNIKQLLSQDFSVFTKT